MCLRLYTRNIAYLRRMDIRWPVAWLGQSHKLERAWYYEVEHSDIPITIVDRLNTRLVLWLNEVIL